MDGLDARPSQDYLALITSAVVTSAVIVSLLLLLYKT